MYHTNAKIKQALVLFISEIPNAINYFRLVKNAITLSI